MNNRESAAALSSMEKVIPLGTTTTAAAAAATSALCARDFSSYGNYGEARWPAKGAHGSKQERGFILWIVVTRSAV